VEEVEMSFGGQDSSGTSDRGLSLYDRLYFGDRAKEEFNYVKGHSDAAVRDPAGLAFMPTVDRLLPVGKYGLHPGTEMGVHQLGRDMFGRASGSRAQRGFNTAHNLEGVTGDAIRMSTGTLLPLQTQYALSRAQMAPQLRGLSMGYAKTPMDVISNLLASSGSSQNQSEGVGMDASTLIPIAAAAIAAGSDRRLKSNIVRIGTHPLGIGWYEYDIYGRREQGVMAQELLEVKPEAVTVMPSGYLGVYYDMIGRM
jgi:hypothetical protein